MSNIPSRWMRLLTDPCSADLEYPCYGGTDAGYLIRTVDTWNPVFTGTGLAPGPNISLDMLATWTPWNASGTTGLHVAISQSGYALNPVQTGFPGSFVSTSAVREYRPVAACLKWVPIGAIGSRAGVICSGYSPGMISIPAVSVSNYMSLAMRKASNGTEKHEVNWLPTSHDEEFTTTTQANSTSCGTVFIAIKNVDGLVATSTTAVPNGYFEVVTVWEWTPATTLGVAMDPRTPSPYTSQSVLSMFGDIRNAIFAGAHSTAVNMATIAGSRAAGAVGGLAGAAANMAIEYAGRSFMGVANARPYMRAGSMPLLRN